MINVMTRTSKFCPALPGMENRKPPLNSTLKL